VTDTQLAPIVLFAYKRADHLSRCVRSLAANPEARFSHLHVYCDGPRTLADTAAVEEVRRTVKGITGFASVNPVFRERNAGLARSIIEGVTSLLERHERVIVVEDDLLLSPHFLQYMNQALDLYAGEENVASVHAYCYPVREPMPETFFLRGADCWGWATWRRAWTHFRADGAALLGELRERNLTRAFDLDGAYPFTRMLADQVGGRNDSWAIRWHASAYLRGMLTLYPGRSLVRNIGNDASGTHSKSTDEFDVDLDSVHVPVQPIPLAENTSARDAFIRFLRPSLWGRIRRVTGAARTLLSAGRR
jgi:hypothetical protein